MLTHEAHKSVANNSDKPRARWGALRAVKIEPQSETLSLCAPTPERDDLDINNCTRRLVDDIINYKLGPLTHTPVWTAPVGPRNINIAVVSAV